MLRQEVVNMLPQKVVSMLPRLAVLSTLARRAAEHLMRLLVELAAGPRMRLPAELPRVEHRMRPPAERPRAVEHPTPRPAVELRIPAQPQKAALRRSKVLEGQPVPEPAAFPVRLPTTSGSNTPPPVT
jgi:hypothetical protein